MATESTGHKAKCMYCDDTGRTPKPMTASGCCPFCAAGKRASERFYTHTNAGLAAVP